MKKALLATLTLGVMLLSACLQDIPEQGCDITTLAIAASVIIDGESYCYQSGSLSYSENDHQLHLELYAVRNEKTTDYKITAVFDVPPDGYQFNQSYDAVGGLYFDAVTLSSGTLMIEGDNHTEDPTLMKYYGQFQLTYQTDGSPTVTTISGNFSWE